MIRNLITRVAVVKMLINSSQQEKTS